jgi:hypothetical protein
MSASTSTTARELKIKPKYILTSMFSYKESTPTQHQMKFVATTRGSSVKRELIAQIDYQIGQEGKVQKVVLKIERSPIPNKEQDAWKMQAEVSTWGDLKVIRMQFTAREPAPDHPDDRQRSDIGEEADDPLQREMGPHLGHGQVHRHQDGRRPVVGHAQDR